VELQNRLEELHQSGLGVVAISYDSREVLAEFAHRRGITFPLLADEDSSVITRFGILNTVVKAGLGPDSDHPDIIAAVSKYVSLSGSHEAIVGTPFPGTFILDANGRVTSRFFETFYKERYSTANVMLKAGIGLTPITATKTTTPHLKLTTYPSNRTVYTGTRFSVAVEVEPNPDIHVYAPGAETFGYRVIGFNLVPTPHVQFKPVEFPKSEIYHFKPLNEHVPVYQNPFTLLQEIVIETSAEAEAAMDDLNELVITGSFNYQACDHSVCHPPVSVPLSFKVRLGSLDTQRASQP